MDKNLNCVTCRASNPNMRAYGGPPLPGWPFDSSSDTPVVTTYHYMCCACLHVVWEYASYLWWSFNFQMVFEVLPLSCMDSSKSTLRDIVQLNDVAISDEVIQHCALMPQKKSLCPYNQVSTLNPLNVEVKRLSLCNRCSMDY